MSGPSPCSNQAVTGWVRADKDARRTLCRPELETELRAIYEQYDWVYDQIAARPEAVVFRGRHPVVSGLVGTSLLVVKRLHHGGLLASIGKDRFLSSRRVRAHIELADYLTTHGIATPPVAFASWRRVRGMVRGEVGFRLIDGAMDADECFFGGNAPRSGLEARAALIGAVVARLHLIGFLHADLNLMNLLFAPGGELYVLDLDKTVLCRGIPPIRARMNNLGRLERSIRKQGRNGSATLVARIVEEVRGAYEDSITNHAVAFRPLGDPVRVDLS